jgi:hypothetical protein
VAAVELTPDCAFLGAELVVSDPSGFQQREAQQPLGMLCRKRQARGATGGVADEVEAVEARRVRGPQDGVGLVLERVPGRWVRRGIDLEVLRDGVHVVAE